MDNDTEGEEDEETAARADKGEEEEAAQGDEDEEEEDIADPREALLVKRAIHESLQKQVDHRKLLKVQSLRVTLLRLLAACL